MSRSPVDRMLDAVAWEEVPASEVGFDDTQLRATHRGTLRLGDLELEVYVLNNGQRVFDAESVARAIGRTP